MPSDFKPIECPPLVTALTQLLPTETGDVLWIVELSPNCPVELIPQAHKVPFAFIPNVLATPAKILYPQVHF